MTTKVFRSLYEITQLNPAEATNAGEVEGATKLKVIFLPSKHYQEKAYQSLLASLGALQETGKLISARIGLKNDDDVFRYLSEK